MPWNSSIDITISSFFFTHYSIIQEVEYTMYFAWLFCLTDKQERNDNDINQKDEVEKKVVKKVSKTQHSRISSTLRLIRRMYLKSISFQRHDYFTCLKIIYYCKGLIGCIITYVLMLRRFIMGNIVTDVAYITLVMFFLQWQVQTLSGRSGWIWKRKSNNFCGKILFHEDFIKYLKKLTMENMTLYVSVCSN